MHRLLQTTSLEPRGTRVASDEDIGAVPRQRDHRVILQRRRVVAQRPVARDQQIHARVEQVPRITVRRKLEHERVTVGGVRTDLLRRRRCAGGPIRSRADGPARVGSGLRNRQARVTEQRTPWASAAWAYSGQRSSSSVSGQWAASPVASAVVSGPRRASTSTSVRCEMSGWVAAMISGSPSRQSVAVAPEQAGTRRDASAASSPSDRELDLSAMLSKSAVSRARSGLATPPPAAGGGNATGQHRATLSMLEPPPPYCHQLAFLAVRAGPLVR